MSSTKPHPSRTAGHNRAMPLFPVTWEHPGDQYRTWTNDRMHFPDPLAPLEFDFLSQTFVAALLPAFQAYNVPYEEVHSRRINTYLYTSMTIAPHIGVASRVMRGLQSLGGGMSFVVQTAGSVMSRRVLDKMTAVMGRQHELWTTQWLPEIQRHLRFWEAFDLRQATTEALLEHLRETISRSYAIWEIHHLIVLQTRVGISMFSELYEEIFGSTSAFDAYRLLEGFDNKTLEGNRALWALSRIARAIPQIRQVLESTPTPDLIAALEPLPEAQPFLTALRDYLAAYGERGDKWGLNVPYWIEDPAPCLKNIKDYITQPDRDLKADLDRLAAQREQLVAMARGRLRGYPRPIIERFEFLLRAAQEATVINEDHGFWIDSVSMHKVRLVLLEFGRRLVASGAIDQPDDVMMLTMEELRAHIAAPPTDLRAQVRARRQEMEKFARVTPPPTVGAPAVALPDNPINRAFDRFTGTDSTDETDPQILRGQPGAPGIVSGPARVIRSLADSGRLQQGDILVAETTAPPWTPLFSTALAVVTDTGGILSHCAVVAREYHIPAVVGTSSATARISDGQLIEVDGNAGIVRILPEATAR